MAQEPQAALEAAVAAAIIASTPPNSLAAYTRATCSRTFDAQPPPACGQVFVAVWFDGRRTSEGRTALNETFGVNVTVTMRVHQPYDRLVQHRDDLEVRANAIRALLHADNYDYRISRAANVLAGFDQTPSQRVGFCESLTFEGMDAVQLVGGNWFHAPPDKLEVGLAQTLRFGKARRIQNTITAS